MEAEGALEAHDTDFLPGWWNQGRLEEMIKLSPEGGTGSKHSKCCGVGWVRAFLARG